MLKEIYFIKHYFFSIINEIFHYWPSSGKPLLLSCAKSSTRDHRYALRSATRDRHVVQRPSFGDR